MDHKHGRKIAVEVRVAAFGGESADDIIGITEHKQSLNPNWDFGSSKFTVRRTDAEGQGVVFAVVAGEEDCQVDVATCQLSISDLEAEVRASEGEEAPEGAAKGSLCIGGGRGAAKV